ncbi:hypothetical protein EDD75_0424 [Thermodesulfitimonas autotrophica]|uniref:TrbC/VIRB2 family protein n=1 Tax=Thermodesulfitimonas autotrophica TaxID=1894989 RepID=A0A3N5BUP2_9THEO|nr:hypothetical protein [Thermodesulfitimonas autotrophica]RPF49605.1 hypothetical protein EDD75_0424 [Thermodesulfitimonas autotrophica]
MRTLALLLLCLFLFAVPARAADAPSNPPSQQQTGIDVKPISPDEVVKSFDKIGNNVAHVGKGMAKNLIPVSFIAAAILILIGFAVASLTKSFLKAGFGVLAGLIVMYILVFHGEKVIGFLKGLTQ